MIGAILAGGLGSRFHGSSKPAALLGGRPLIAWPIAALGGVCSSVVVVCKADTDLPPLPGGVERWEEPDEPRHPAAGMVAALERARAPVLVCAADMPFVTEPVCRRLLEHAATTPDAPAVVARAQGRMEPLLCLLRPGALEPLREALAGEAMRASMQRLGAVAVDVPSRATASVNTPEQLAAAQVTVGAPDPTGGG
jgi:molybdopterin-guanine dinucleotide biosynthesis protein A